MAQRKKKFRGFTDKFMAANAIMFWLSIWTCMAIMFWLKDVSPMYALFPSLGAVFSVSSSYWIRKTQTENVQKIKESGQPGMKIHLDPEEMGRAMAEEINTETENLSKNGNVESEVG